MKHKRIDIPVYKVDDEKLLSDNFCTESDIEYLESCAKKYGLSLRAYVSHVISKYTYLHSNKLIDGDFE